ncbi:MAG TPA: hypothetical protein VFA79_13925 [Myxococcales bacterium]|nr:hypothetical protein [Myxococcales bacterium]
MNRIVLAGSVLLATACAASTPYQPLSYKGGFSDTQLEKSVFEVRFAGNETTTPARATDLALLRSAEVALEHGYNYFIIAEQQAGASNQTAATGLASTKAASASVVNRIVCYQERPEAAGAVYDARFVRLSIRRKYELGP